METLTMVDGSAQAKWIGVRRDGDGAPELGGMPGRAGRGVSSQERDAVRL
jgi:hypothetical protein